MARTLMSRRSSYWMPRREKIPAGQGACVSTASAMAATP
jgi:hypothetical protein